MHFFILLLVLVVVVIDTSFVLFFSQQPSGCRSINLMEQRHILPPTPLEQPAPNLAPVSLSVQ